MSKYYFILVLLLDVAVSLISQGKAADKKVRHEGSSE